MRLVDAHCHLEVKDYPDVAAILEGARAAGLVHAIVVGQFHGPGDWGNALELAAAHPDFLSPTLGIHPHEAARATEEDFATLEKTCARPEVRAVGEAGLDYYYDHSPREVQATVFRRQCALALQLAKPLVVHVRDAHDDCEAVLREVGLSRGVIHCFTGDTDAARRYLNLGFFLSLSGVVTYKNAQALQDAVRFAPLDRLMVETDSPYLAPVPHRGRKNQPAHVVETARKVAELKGVTLEEVAATTTANASALFGLSLR
ncbi:TatD family hydrolase [Pyxidicoccus xibeiensis]|uniref:TatD family hydrolase n=1 Tax=Pyxidicoccus xibeiensis TaxID=2906759 RepID=UPI0020A7E57E|nr:TatD family hydrolase [Pyxidicoccus xibeiensis]MCP3141025.1 TatD family hydrolase [Pyxidicoccus xibeiensis]